MALSCLCISMHHPLAAKPFYVTYSEHRIRLSEKQRIENISPKFRAWIDKHYGKHFEPEEIFGFIYAVLHSQISGRHYGEFLRRSFPRISLPRTQQAFVTLACLGWDLAQKHLLKDVPSLGLARYNERGNHEVDRIAYSPYDASRSHKRNAEVHSDPSRGLEFSSWWISSHRQIPEV